MKKLVLIDGHALVHRAFHALPLLNSPSGVPTNAIFGFFSVLLKMIKELKPEYIAAAFDLAGPTFRHEEFAEYKSHRVKAPDELHAQVPYIKEILMAMGIPIYEKAGFEADDAIGTISLTSGKEKGLQTVIMTGDLDTLQLVKGDTVVVFTLRKGVTDTMTYNEKEVKTRYGLAPDQLVDFKGLKGDPSDNIPGVPGIGDKTASALIGTFGNLEKLYDALDKKVKKPKVLTEKLIEKLKSNKDQAFFSKKLATIIRTVDIQFDLNDAQWRTHMDRAVLEKILKDLALYNIVKRLNELDGVAQPAAAAPQQAPLLPVADLLSTPTTIVASLEKISGPIIFDIFGQAVWFSCQQGEYGFSETVLKNKDVQKVLVHVLADATIHKTVHDAKEIARWALVWGFTINGLVFDTRLAAFILNSDTRDYTPERLYFAEFGSDATPSANRLVTIGALAKKYRERLEKEGLMSVLKTIELPLSPVLARMEYSGILVDETVVKKLAVMVNKELEKLEKEIHKHAKSEFNINSPQQLSVILFDTLGLKGKVKKTGKGARSTAAGELEKLVDEHPVVSLILKYRELQKLKTTYIEPLPLLINKKDHRLHTTYNQAGATTGRLSSQDPNLQNIPIRTELGQEFRKAFVADTGNVLLSCDYSQLELRIAAHISGDVAMIEAFKRGEDIHTRTAASVFRVKPELVTKDMRRQAKVLNFGVLYGMGILGFQRASGVSRDEARVFIANYLNGFPGLAKYMDEMKEKAHREGMVETVFHRRRLLPDIRSTMPAVQAGAERIAINSPVQGTAADLIKLAMIDVQKMLDEKYKDKVQMLLQVHDELLFEVKKDLVREVAPKIVKLMETVHTFNVPIVVDAKVGDNWADMQELKK